MSSAFKLRPQWLRSSFCVISKLNSPAVHGYDQVVVTANKMLKLAKVLSCQVICTTQNAKALGPIDPDIDLKSLGPGLIDVFDKTLFSMLTAEVKSILSLDGSDINSIVVFGIESHICVLQTVLDLLSLPKPYSVYVIADGVSSCNQFEVPIALARMQKAGAILTTSESIAFELVRDAAKPEFKTFSRLIKDEKENTRRAGQVLAAGLFGSSSVSPKSAM